MGKRTEKKVNVVNVELALSFRSKGSALSHQSSICSGQGQSDSSLYAMAKKKKKGYYLESENKELWGG